MEQLNKRSCTTLETNANNLLHNMNPTSRVISVVPSPPNQLHTSANQGQETSNSLDSNVVDFIGPSIAVKSLFSVPYLTDQGVAVAVHNVGGTLLIDISHPEDESPVQTISAKFSRKRQRSAQKSKPVLPPNYAASGKALAIVTTMLDKTRVDEDEHQSVQGKSNFSLPPPEHYVSHSLPSEPNEYLQWRFRELKMLIGSDALVYRAENHSVTVRTEEASHMDQLLKQHQDMVARGEFRADHQFPALQQAGKPSYAIALSRIKAETTIPSTASFAAPNLDQVQLQTCIVPPIRTPLGSILSSQCKKVTTPVCTVLDVYLDNLMANVPQLALCLQEKGLIQCIKLMETKDIPASLMDAKTLDTSIALSNVDTTSAGKPLFSPQIMEMNAATLLRFLKANCTRDNATYLLRKEAGEANIQLYDISSISAQRQRKWIWWLSMMSYRFALRLNQLARNRDEESSRKREFRARQRSLLQNALNLLEDLADMDGGQHATLRSSVSENLADTFLSVDDETSEKNQRDEVERLSTAASPPYSNVSIDALNKAQDHLNYGIKQLWPIFEEARQSHIGKQQRRENPLVIDVQNEGLSSSDEDDSEERSSIEMQSMALQLFGLHHKLINVALRLAEHHLKNYWSSCAMQSLRSAARKIADAISLVEVISQGDDGDKKLELSLKYQYTWLWEHCGHFARSFAADNLWRDRGHACGDDVISLLRDVDAAFGPTTMTKSCYRFVRETTPLSRRSGGMVSLLSVQGVLGASLFSTRETYSGGNDMPLPSLLMVTTKILDQQKIIQRDARRVLVSACLCYSRSIHIFDDLLMQEGMTNKNTDPWTITESTGPSALSLLRQRFGDACNEIGKILLNELRSVLSGGPTILSEDEILIAAEILLFSAEFWFNEGLSTFYVCNDLRNIALLRCNLCQCCKLRANSNFASKIIDSKLSIHAEVCLQDGAGHLQKAQEALCERDNDPITWDMVSQELAATFLVLGVRRRQALLGGGTTPVATQALRLNPGKERSIIDPMEKALMIYNEVGNSHQAAAVNYQIALFYSKVWTCQRDEAKTRAKLAAAFKHYGAAHAYFSNALVGNEPTFVLLCLDLANLYAVVSGEECLSKALARCLETDDAFAFHTSPSPQWLEKMQTLAVSVEERVLKVLVSLVKLEREYNSGEKYKGAYRVALMLKMKLNRGDATGTHEYSPLQGIQRMLRAIKTYLTDENCQAKT